MKHTILVTVHSNVEGEIIRSGIERYLSRLSVIPMVSPDYLKVQDVQILSTPTREETLEDIDIIKKH